LTFEIFERIIFYRRNLNIILEGEGNVYSIERTIYTDGV